MLDEAPIIHKIAKGLLSLLTAVGGVTIAMRAAHARQVEENIELRRERKIERQTLRGSTAVPPVTTPIPSTVSVAAPAPFVRVVPGNNGSGPTQFP